MPRRTAPLAPTEHQIQQSIIGFLEYRGYYVQRMNSGKFVAGAGASRRMIQGARPGTPDIMAFKNVPLAESESKCIWPFQHTALLFIEVKRPGNKPTPLQEAVMSELTGHGARCIVAHSTEELEAQL